jgi:hypothetical protein
VYLIGTGWDHVKIGRSASPTARLSELQVASPEVLRLLKSWDMDRSSAKLFERALHEAFAWAAVRGEWFRVDWRIVARLRAAASKCADARRGGLGAGRADGPPYVWRA